MIGLNQSIRVRLTLWYSGVLFGGLCLAGVFVWVLLSHGLRADLDSSLRARTKGLERYLALEASSNLNRFQHEMDEYSRSLPVDYVMYVQDSDGHVLTSSLNEGNPLARSVPSLTLQGYFGGVTVRGVPYRLYGDLFRENDREYSVILASSSNFIDTTLDRLAFLLVGMIPGLVIVAAAGGYVLSKRALSPVVRMTAEADAIGFDNLSARLAVPRIPDEIQRLATTWNAMLQRIEDSVKRMNRFTADASHELRTPVSLIQARTELALRRPRDPEQYREALRVIRVEAGRMARLVEDLLFLARTDSDASPRCREFFDLRIPMQTASLEVSPKAMARKVEIRQEMPEESILVFGDEDAIRRMIFVFLDNAVKYSPAECEVVVVLTCDGGAATLSVHDRGTGIPPQAVPHIFERFYRADSSRYSETPSYGLGLAIADAVAKQHGLSVDVNSEPGSTWFMIQFKIANAIEPCAKNGGRSAQ